MKKVTKVLLLFALVWGVVMAMDQVVTHCESDNDCEAHESCVVE